MRAPTLARSLHGYQRRWLGADLLAAAALLVIAVPTQIATARLAGMPPITGFYAFAAGSLAIALLGSSPRLVIGSDSTIAPLFAISVAGIAAAGSRHYVGLVGLLAVMIGVLLALVWLLRLAWIAEFLSAPIITGFLAGIAIVIIIHQLPDLLGVRGGASTTLGRLHELIGELPAVRWWPLAIGLGVLAVIDGCERLDRRLPGALLALVLSTLLVAAASLRSHGVAVLGHVRHGAPSLGLHGVSLGTIGRLGPVAGIVALVVITQTAATTRAFTREGEPEPDVGRDLLSVGAGCALAGVAGAFPVDASPPLTATVTDAGGRTQLTSVLAAGAMIALIPAAGALRYVPLATLAGVLLFIATRIFRVRELVAIAHFDRFELALALATLSTVALAGVDVGIGVAVGLAILDRTRISAHPKLHVLGRVPGTTSWAPISTAEGAEQLPGILVVLFPTPLWYGNSVHFGADFDVALTRSVGGPPRLVVLDALGMTDIDYTGAVALRRKIDGLARRGCRFAIARAEPGVIEELHDAGVVPGLIGDDRLFSTVDEAVRAPAGSPSERSPLAQP